MEQINIEQHSTSVKEFHFDELLKPTNNYDVSNFKKSESYKIISKKIFNSVELKDPKVKKLYKELINQNYYLGALFDIYDLFKPEYKLKEEFVLKLIPNIFSDFGLNSKLDLVEVNELLEKIASSNVDEEINNEIEKYNNEQSVKDIKTLKLKNINSYEFYDRWLSMNSVINYFFTKIGQKELGNHLALLFLVTYESQKEMLDFVSSSLVSSENLKEDYLFNSQNSLLEEVFDELKKQNTDIFFTKELIRTFLSIIPNYQLNVKSVSFMSKILNPSKRNEKFRLFMSDETMVEIAKKLKVLSLSGKQNTDSLSKTNSVKVLNEEFKISSSEIRAAKNILLKTDKIDYIAALAESYFKSKKIRYNKYRNFIAIIKLATLAYGYSSWSSSRNSKYKEAKKIFEIMMLQFAEIESKEFCQELSKVFANNNFKDDFVEKNIPKEYSHRENVNDLIKVVDFVFEKMELNTKLMENTIRYYVVKNELFELENNKKIKKIFGSEELTISSASYWQKDLIYNIEMIFANEKSNLAIKYVRFMTETYGKLYLSDKPPMTGSQKVMLVAIYLILALWVLIIAYPIFQVIIQAFNWYSSNESSGMNGNLGNLGIFDFVNFQFSGSNFVYLFKETQFTNWLINSLVISITSMIAMVILVALIGYAFSRFRFKGKKISLMTVLLIQMIPTVSSFVAFYIMTQILNQWIGMTGKVMLIIIYTGGGIPGNVFVLKGYMDNISMDIDEAAKIDGCGSITIFTRIIAPLSKPMLSVIALWSFIGPFGDVMLPPMLLNDISEYTMASGLRTLIGGVSTKAQGSFAAGSIIIAVPISALFLGLQKNITGGLSAAGVKG
ncbi:arabinogalactan oligomer/maltooligosaccharide transport system permease protein [Spiroplasma chinense]|uniref:Arabinogalactan oligomer/maltooligosaccharide transport system permease protein n=1 Tax=Spiroplasma chinense TaxID=216932 RepID=A0A5B9Y8C1_9MOLU|nr:sugar ABC transporter permease [Spiroplasma chinense]QEH62272.1 arabinogalactan oligomer/maltooligosaccharide transport system permease protein [Spiroplasma chinense]